MVKSGDDGSGSVPPFLKKCYDMVDDEATDSIVSWGTTGRTFLIWDMTQFSVQLLPKYFRHSNFSSFRRQLNIYGFRKTDTDRWEFTNEGFVRGQKHLLKNITRRKHTPGSDQRKPAHQDISVGTTTLEKVEYSGLWKEVENLKIDKKALAQELVKLKQHQESADNKLLLFTENLQEMETKQQQMLSFLVMAMQNPEILVQFLQQKENDWHMNEHGARIVEHGAEDDELMASDGMIVRYQPLVDETLNPPASVSEKQQDSDPFFDGMKDLVVNVDFMKMLMDEKQCSMENHAPLVLPDIPDDFTWEQLLLTGPFSGNIADVEQDNEEPLENGVVEMELRETQMEDSQNFELLIKEMEDFQTESAVDGSDLDDSVERLAEQIEQLAYEPEDEAQRNVS